MRKPFTVAGQTVPQAPGKCHRCGHSLIEPRAASTTQIAERFRLVCRDRAACQQRRQDNR